MDIIKVTKQSVRTAMDECGFEINSVLARPQEKGSLDELDKATARFARLSAQFQILSQLETQSAEAGKATEAVVVPQNES